MNTKIFQEALQATARIACCASLVSIVACQTQNEDTASTDTDISATVDSAEPSIEEQITIPDPPNFDDCMIAIDEGFSNENFDTSELLDCCLLTTEEVGFDDLYNNPEFTNLQEDCCAEIAQQGEWSTACTPWGPPTPPCMKGATNA